MREEGGSPDLTNRTIFVLGNVHSEYHYLLRSINNVNEQEQ